MAGIVHQLLAFTDDRHWSIYHNVKNVSTALLVEAAELRLAVSKGQDQDIVEEAADVASYFVLLCYYGGLHPDVIDAMITYGDPVKGRSADEIADEVLECAARMAESYQWVNPSLKSGAEDFTKRISGKDIVHFFSLLAEITGQIGFDLVEAMVSKLESNKRKYPATNKDFSKYSGGMPPVGVVRSLHASARPEYWDEFSREMKGLIPMETRRRAALLFDFDEKVSLERIFLIYGLHLDAFNVLPLCQIPDPHAIFSMDMFSSISDRRLQSIIFDTIKHGHRLVSMGPVLTYVNKFYDQNVFGPTIDTLLLNAGLINIMHDRSGKLGRVLELGTGSGFVAKSVLAHADSFDHLTVADLLPEIVDVARRNMRPMDYDVDWNRVLFTVGPNCLYTVADDSIDLLVCNPPYIPGEFKSGPISGLDVYDMLLGEQGARVMHPDGSMLLVVSSVSRFQVEALLKEHDRFVFVRTHLERMVPFDLLEINLDDNHLEYLLREEGIIDRCGTKYHRVYVMEFRRKRAGE